MFIELVYRVVGVLATLSVAMRDERHFARVIENIIGSAGYRLFINLQNDDSGNLF